VLVAAVVELASVEAAAAVAWMMTVRVLVDVRPAVSVAT
jgi:hypothetical protein